MSFSRQFLKEVQDIAGRLDTESLERMAALLAQTAFYVGNDTGFLNMAAAVGARAYGLYATSEPFQYLRQIVPIYPPDGRVSRVDGMTLIRPEAVVAAIVSDRNAGVIRPSA